MKKLLIVLVVILITCACSISPEPSESNQSIISEPTQETKETRTPSVELFEYYENDLGINIGIPQGWVRKSSTTQIGSENNVPITSFTYQNGSSMYYLTLMTISIHKYETPQWIVEDALGIGSDYEVADSKNFRVMSTNSKVKIDGNSSYMASYRVTQISTNQDLFSVTLATDNNKNEWLLIQFSCLEKDQVELETFITPILLSISFLD